MKINWKILGFIILTSMVALLNLTPFVGACLAGNPPVWVNCTVVTNASSPLGNIIGTDKAGGSYVFFFMWVAIYISIAIFLLRQDKSFARFNAITFMGMIVAIVFRMFGLVGQFTVTASIAVFGLCFLASLFYR